MRRFTCLLVLSVLAAAEEMPPVSTAEMTKRVPPGVRYLPDLAYREGNPAWRLDLAMPERTDRPRPGMVFVHGGGWVVGDKRQGHSGDLPLEFARRGFVAISVNYRMAPEYPLPACIEDVKCAVRWFRAHAEEFHLDPKRIGAFGYSAGAHLVAMLALAGPKAGFEGDGPYQDYPSDLQAAAMGGTPAVVPWREMTDAEMIRLFGAPLSTAYERARRSSPVTWARADAPPMLLLEGAKDPVSKVDELSKALNAAGARNFIVARFDGADHNMLADYLPVVRGAIIGFFESTLGAER